MQYSRQDLNIHGTVECYYIDGGDNIALGGPVNVQKDPGQIFSGEWMYVEIRADGVAVRVRGGSASASDSNCNASGSFPGQVVEGGFNIR
jgi:hypothetical protein